MSFPKISISNLAWNAAEDEQVSELLLAHGITHVDLAMGKYFEKPTEATIGDWIAIKNAWGARGIQIVGMQSLLFGVGPANIFGSVEDRIFLEEVFSKVFERAASIGVTRLVFGSPGNRRRITMETSELELAREFFIRVGNRAFDLGVKLLVEPNSTRYQCNFLNSASEVGAFISNLPTEGLGINLDLGAQTDSGELLGFDVELLGHMGHMHISEPNLGPIAEAGLLAEFSRNEVLVSAFEFATIEQLGQSNASNLGDVLSSLEKVLQESR
jgi:sugar phosphate isomerase/epimerase